MPCGRIGASELLLIFLAIVLLFGASRLPELGKGLGLGIRRFKKSLHEPDEDEEPKAPRRVEKRDRDDA
jgi:sec-independent protein translocase protein TatA